MPDPEADATAQATPPAETAESTPPPEQTTTAEPTDAIGHVSDEDFKDPRFGAKLKNLYNGLQEKAGKYSELERTHKDLDGRWQRVVAVLQAPSVAAAVRAHLSGQSAPPQQSADENEDPEVKSRKALKEEMMAELRAEQALSEAAIQLGSGDLEKGRKLFTEQVGDLNEIMNQMVGGDPRAQLRLAMDILRLRNASKQSPVATPHSAPPPRGTAESETTRGSPSGNPPPEPKNDDERMMAALKEAGFNSPADYMRAVGAI